jgi:lysozyme family protein
MVEVAALKLNNARRWAAMHLHAARLGAFTATAKRLSAPDAKPRYEGVTERLMVMGKQPVPWWFIAIVSEREYGGPPRWDRQLGQGDPLHQVSHNEPAGRGPFLDHPGDTTPGNDAWTRCCLDALIDCAPHAANWTDWSIGGVLTLFEEYNGLGYAARGVPSAYVWSGTDQYVSGKYVADHVYRNDVVDVQEGCAPILACMMVIDPSISFNPAAVA